MNNKRPVHLDLLKIKQPLGAWVSILHRISGILLFVTIPIALVVLQHSLSSESDFNYLFSDNNRYILKLFIGFGLWAFLYHLLAGIRALALDLMDEPALPKARGLAKAVIALSALAGALILVWLW